jgi:CRP-like cAMP-binding protein
LVDTNQLPQLPSAADMAALNEHLRPVEWQQGDVLAEPGDELRIVYFPSSGIVSFMVELIDGSIVQAGMIGRDGVVGAAQAVDNKTSINKLIVQVPGMALMIDRSPLRDLIERGVPITERVL